MSQPLAPQDPGAAARRWTATAGDRGERLDVHLAARLGEPRNQVQRWIRSGLVTVDGRLARPALLLRGGEQIACAPPPPAVEERVLPETAELRVLFEDDCLVVLDKPAGLAVHPGAGRSTGTLAHRLLARYPEMAGVGGAGRPGIVHRLDKDTTGLLVAARTAPAHRRLAAAFARREVEKIYIAIASGAPRARAWRIEAPIGRHRLRRKEMAVRADGRPAITDVRVRAATASICLLEATLRTGRTHQIRVHLKSAGHPLVGDPVYGGARWAARPKSVQALLRDFPRPALHAWRLAFAHPLTGEELGFESPVPEDLRELWRAVAGGELLAALSG